VRVLIAGCNGLLGQNLLSTAPPGTSLLGLARHDAPARPDLLAQDAYHARDIAEAATWAYVRDTLKPDIIFNAAAYTDVDGCERDPALCARINRDAVALMAATGIPLVHVSTDYVFDGLAGPYAEHDPVNPLSVYGRVKLESETAALSGSSHNVVVRTMWVWGSGKGAKKSFTEFVRETLAAGQPVRAVTDQVGNPTLAEDLALAIWALVEKGCSGVYHATGAERVNRLEWAHAVARHYGLDDAGIEPLTTPSLGLPAARPLESGLLCDKLARDTGVRLRGLTAQLKAT
jgi:dTDP-4-dehydrorhamnose reductase